MLRSAFLLLVLVIASAGTAVVADIAQDEDPVLRLRFADTLEVPALKPILRPRIGAIAASPAQPAQRPVVSLAEAGRVGTFAYVSTPHPNLVFAVGAMEDRTEVGRQIDRAILGSGGENQLFNQTQDSAPFIGLGVRSNHTTSGWSMDATIGAGFTRGAENARLLSSFSADQTEAFETEARANLRLKYTF